MTEGKSVVRPLLRSIWGPNRSGFCETTFPKLEPMPPNLEVKPFKGFRMSPRCLFFDSAIWRCSLFSKPKGKMVVGEADYHQMSSNFACGPLFVLPYYSITKLV